MIGQNKRNSIKPLLRDDSRLEENIRLLKYILLPIEFQTLRLIFEVGSPQSPGAIYARILVRIYLDKVKKTPFLTTREAEKCLRKKGVYFPSYPKIVNVLGSLERAGFLVQRAGEGKEKTLWIISPAFYLKYGKAFENSFIVN